MGPFEGHQYCRAHLYERRTVQACYHSCYFLIHVLHSISKDLRENGAQPVVGGPPGRIDKVAVAVRYSVGGPLNYLTLSVKAYLEVRLTQRW